MILLSEAATANNTNLLMNILAVIGALGTPLFAYLQYRARMQVENLKAEREAEKLKGEAESIAVGTANEVLGMVRDNLRQEMKENEALRREVEALRDEVHMLREEIRANEGLRQLVEELRGELSEARLEIHRLKTRLGEAVQ